MSENKEEEIDMMFDERAAKEAEELERILAAGPSSKDVGVVSVMDY